MMHFKKSAAPVACATSSDHTPSRSAGDLNEKATQIPAAAGASGVRAPARIHERAQQAGHASSASEGSVSNVLMLKAAPHRKQHAYLIPYTRLRELLGFAGEHEQSVALNSDRLQQATRLLLRAVHVDEDWYFRQYPDVKEAVAGGVFRSAKHHFIESGYFEGRKPARVVVDEDWYVRAYPDVAESVEFGELNSCQEHFDVYGEAEGRLPAED